MIVSFAVENWMSFRDRAEISMVAGSERQHGSRVARVKKLRLRVLPVCAMYGGNAAGKSNLCKALAFAKQMVTKGTKPKGLIAVRPFKLDQEASRKPCRFHFEILVEDVVYEYEFAVTREAVQEEKLTEIGSSRETVLFHRQSDGSYSGAAMSDEFMKFVGQGTRPNQLLLTEAASRNVKQFAPIYDWFSDSLQIILPNSFFQNTDLFIHAGGVGEGFGDMLRSLDTGITRLGSQPVAKESIPPFFLALSEDVEEGERRHYITDTERFILARKGGEISAEKLVSFHTRTDGGEVMFDIDEESDGSRRLFDLLPALMRNIKSNSKRVYVIDELDRSLHTLLSRRLLEMYLAGCSAESRRQLLFTTHDVLLMDQKNLFRRDEMWVAERDMEGVSSLISLAEYKNIRYDKDIGRSYLRGLLGGIPRLLLQEHVDCNRDRTIEE